MDIQWAFDLRELKNQRFARAGITSYGLSPGTQALLAGQAALVHTSAERTEDAFLARRIALKGNYTAAVKRTFKAKEGPQTRMAMYQLLDEAFRSAQEYSEKEKKDYDEGKEVLCRVLRREIPLIMTANTALEAESVVEGFLSAAVMGKLETVTIIHGKGTGALRKAVHDILRRNKAVKSFRLGVYGEGETGVTVVTMK